MLFKLPAALAMALLTLGASSLPRTVESSLEPRQVFNQNRGVAIKPEDGARILANDAFETQFNPIMVGEHSSTLDIRIYLVIPKLNHNVRLATNLMSEQNAPIKQNFIFRRPSNLDVTRNTEISGRIEFHERQGGNFPIANGQYFVSRIKNVTFVL
ncbi:BQ2448_1073 [Microbotryum intermedium]|uniref:BQ2448_1073 protein n=1 Tax=Microbotryum intermedium TaxID=269621 RepID=A0A238FA92_9BASI|nr:BQ2448_1073 [Microbotryum intermedium]